MNTYRYVLCKAINPFWLISVIVCLIVYGFYPNQARAFSNQVISFNEAMFLSVQNVEPPSTTHQGWRKVALLDNWYVSHHHEKYPAWYYVEFNLEELTHDWAIYLPAVNSNAVVWLNGERLGGAGSMQDPVARNWHRPLYFTVPRLLLRKGNNVVHIQLRPKNSGFGYLGAIHVGYQYELYPVYKNNYFYKQTLIGASTVLLFSTSIFILFLWFMRKRDSLYAWFAAAGFSWSFFVFDMYVQHVTIQETIWDAFVFSSVGWLVIFMTIFFHRFWNLYYPHFERFILIFGITGTIVLLLVGEDNFYFVSSFIWDNLLIIFSTYMTWFIITQCVKWPSPEAWFLALALAVVVSFGGHDNLVQMGLIGVDRTRLLPYGAPFLLGVMLWMLVQRYVNALNEAEDLNVELDEKVKKKSRELEDNYLRLKQTEQEKILSQERERLMRDMHDGTGGHLVSALAQVQKGEINTDVLMQTLQSALDDVRLMIDSMDQVEEDVVAVLAMFRSRMELRLKSSGIQVVWDIQDVPPVKGLGPEKILHLMRILHEAVTNVIKHSSANQITFRTDLSLDKNDKQVVVIEIEDNGIGFGENIKNEGRGIANMYWRASEINAHLDMFDVSSGAVVRILFNI